MGMHSRVWSVMTCVLLLLGLTTAAEELFIDRPPIGQRAGSLGVPAPEAYGVDPLEEPPPRLVPLHLSYL